MNEKLFFKILLSDDTSSFRYECNQWPIVLKKSSSLHKVTLINNNILTNVTCLSCILYLFICLIVYIEIPHFIYMYNVHVASIG